MINKVSVLFLVASTVVVDVHKLGQQAFLKCYFLTNKYFTMTRLLMQSYKLQPILVSVMSIMSFLSLLPVLILYLAYATEIQFY